MSPPHHDRHEWFFNSEGYLSPYRAGEVFKKLAEDLLQESNGDGGGAKLGDVEIALPDEFHVTVRYERKPKGELVLKVELEWTDGGEARGVHPISQFLT
jgi:hypothetical protein